VRGSASLEFAPLRGAGGGAAPDFLIAVVLQPIGELVVLLGNALPAHLIPACMVQKTHTQPVVSPQPALGDRGITRAAKPQTTKGSGIIRAGVKAAAHLGFPFQFFTYYNALGLYIQCRRVIINSVE
jgi:hypothetical protein